VIFFFLETKVLVKINKHLVHYITYIGHFIECEITNNPDIVSLRSWSMFLSSLMFVSIWVR